MDTPVRSCGSGSRARNRSANDRGFCAGGRRFFAAPGCSFFARGLRLRACGLTRHQLRTRLFTSLLGALFVATAASAQQKPKLHPLRIALPSHSVSATAVYVARSIGIFERYGFDPQILVLEPRAALAAMLTGDLDFYSGVGTVGRAALRGVPVRVVLVALNRSDLVLPASKDITAVEQLRGKALGGYMAQASVNVHSHRTLAGQRASTRRIYDTERREGSGCGADERQCSRGRGKWRRGSAACEERLSCPGTRRRVRPSFRWPLFPFWAGHDRCAS